MTVAAGVALAPAAAVEGRFLFGLGAAGSGPARPEQLAFALRVDAATGAVAVVEGGAEQYAAQALGWAPGVSLSVHYSAAALAVLYAVGGRVVHRTPTAVPWPLAAGLVLADNGSSVPAASLLWMPVPQCTSAACAAQGRAPCLDTAPCGPCL